MSVDSSYQSDAINKRRQLRELMSARRATELRPIGASSSTLIPDLQNRHEPFPLTDIQEAYWLGRDTAFPLGGVGIHGYFELLCPDLDVERLQEAWNAVVRRHDMMRAIVLCDGSARIIEHVPCYIIPVEDLRDRTTQEQQRHRHELRARMSHQVFDVEKWPLFELRIVRLDQHRFRLHYSEDAIHSDLRSTALVMSDWLQLYRDPAVQLRPIPLSYRDYALAMHRRPQSADYARAKRYWDARLDTLPESPQLPLKGNLTGLRMAFARRKFTLTASRWQRFREQASKHGLTPSDALLATYVDVLGLWSTRRRFALNVTLQNRLPLHSQVNEISGDFTSFVLLDVDAGSSGGFVERASRYRDQLWSDLEHNEMSGVSVLRELARRRRSGDVVAPYVFTSALGTSGYRAIEELGEVEFEITQTPQVLLDQQAVEWRGQLVLTWDCVDAAFADGVIDEMFSWMSQRINQLCDEASEWSAQSRVSIPVAQQRRRDAFNATSAEFPRERLERMFARRAQEDRGRVAIVDHRGSMSYGELDDASSGLALALRAVPDLDAAVPVAIGMRKSRDEIVAVLGILKAGLSYLPLEISQPASRIERILSTAGCRAVIVDDDAPEWISRLEGRRRVLSLKDGQSAGNFAELPEIRDSDVAAYVLFTSGSTGDPKGVVVTHDSVVNRMLDVVERFAIGRHDRAMGLTGLHHDLAVFDIFGMLSVAGGTLIVPSPDVIEAPAKWPDFIDAHGVSIWNSVPAYLDLLLAHCEARPAQAARICGLRLALIAGDFIPPSLPLRFRGNTHGRFIALGGPTETTVWDICYPVEALPHGWSAIPYGKPMRNAKYFVLREDLSECPDWVEGELCIAGAGLAIGYLRDTVLSGARFVTHPESGERIYRSGDRGRVRPDGLVEILGRL
ncbi:MAG TPA: AMP-binding protein, partial [Steroidobacteraceae bacterium]|nr:AMP-binding protein [Steroidobacteraceae bacterium]